MFGKEAYDRQAYCVDIIVMTRNNNETNLSSLTPTTIERERETMDPTIDLGNEEGAHASAVAKVAKYRIFVVKYRKKVVKYRENSIVFA